VLGFCAKADANVSPAERIYFAAAQNDCSDEKIFSFWFDGIEPRKTSSSDVRR
jgi:hypothetical protein